jgi:sigma-E factor negative regulatory protein RseC
MIEETGTVVGVEHDGLIVEVLRTSACQSCQARNGCGQAVLAEWGESERQQKKNHFKVPYDGTAAVGNRIDLGMEPDAVSIVALLVYIVPLIFGFAGLFLAQTLNFSEGLQLVVLIVCFALSFFYISRLKINKSPILVPKILRLYSSSKISDVIASTGAKSV